ncbi:hypothetical protein QN372_01215 [Undibacterium sp. RTI2.1]|uniref:hypothetical protein n=1 Tax=unclassified Undibacterium TaxID=2630295 RepID=UPI002B23CAB5|nr:MULTISPECIES: hypothetical protein [unclassified Undibacterium]MEB0029357.1 hypothetical protein [Undibacterium sp. RTI2.1]MEB0116025.1 hypothetical protein [Undibacterium sp. RTI2.2]
MKSIAKRIIHNLVVGITTVALCMPMLEIASASTSGSSGARSSGGSSRSFKSGFSSQRNSNGNSNSANNNIGNTSKTNTGFGSFSSSSSSSNAPANAANATATNTTVNNNAGKSNSALNRDLDTSRSQNTALKNLDARTTPSATPNTSNQPGSVSVTGKPLGTSSNAFGNTAQGSTAQGSTAAPAYGQPMQQAPSTIIVQRESSGMGGAFWGFMLGQSMSHHSYGGYGGNYGSGYDNRARDVGNAGDASNATNPTATVSNNDKAQESESWFWRLLRLMLWTAILSSIAWVGYKLFRLHTARTQARTQNYSLGKV